MSVLQEQMSQAGLYNVIIIYISSYNEPYDTWFRVLNLNLLNSTVLR